MGLTVSPSSGGDVVGPASNVADRIAAFSGTTGKLLQDGTYTTAQVGTAVNNAVTVDTGWTQDADDGDKTAVISDAATLTALATAMDGAVAGSGAALFSIAQKLKALVFAVESKKRPDPPA